MKTFVVSRRRLSHNVGGFVRLPRPLFPRTILLLLAFLTPTAQAQIPPSNNTTSTPIPGAGHDYLGGLAETVNPANGSLSVRLPVIMPPSRGITLPFSFAYDSNGVNYVARNAGGNLWWYTTAATNTQGGWSNSKPIVTASQLTWTTTDAIGHVVRCYAWVNYVFQDAKGNRHNLNLTVYNDPAGTGPCSYNTSDWTYGFDGEVVTQGGEGPILATTTDVAGQTQKGDVVVTDGDGTILDFGPPIPITDRNGNVITITTGYDGYVDTAGRTALQDSGFGVSPETVTISGLGAPYTLSWTPLSVPTFATPVTTLSGSCSVPSHSGPWVNYAGTTVQGVTALTLPNGKGFSFTYDPAYGLVNKITYPTGGYVRYVWGMNAQAEGTYCTDQHGIILGAIAYGMPAISDRYVSFDGSTEVLHQHFTYSTSWNGLRWASKQTTVTTTDNVRNTSFDTIYTYSSIDGNIPPNTANSASAAGGSVPPQIPVEASIAYYYDTNGALLKTVSKTWQNERLLKSVTTAYPNGQTSQTTYSYDSNEMQIEQDDYDFGPGAPGALLRKIVTSYATFGTNHIVDKPSSVKTYDSSGTNLVAETDYSYDETTPIPTSGVLQHSGGCHCGNLTTKSVWVDGSGSQLKTTYTYDDTGQILTMKDPRLNTTTYSYADSFTTGGPTGGVTNAYLTTVTHPQTNGVNHIEKYSYDYPSGEVTTSTDQNNLVTTYKYVDNLARLTETDFPDGSQTTIAYNDAPYNPSTPSPSVTTTKKINVSASLVTVSAMDGLGHVVRTLLSSDPQGTVYTDIAYDGLAQVKSVSNPYRSGTDPTSSPGTTSFAYDAIGRKTSETAPDGSIITTAYCAGSTLVTDPTNRWRRSRTDGLGRLVEVDEPNAVGASVGSTGCPGTGDPIWITSYTLDALGNLTNVVQNGSHHRSFVHDWLSRLVTSNNPEVGTTTYSYDANGNVVSKTSLAPNQTGAGAPGTGSATLSGSEQSIPGSPATPGNGSVTFNGALQSKQQQTQPATPGTGWVTIGGAEQSTQIYTCYGPSTPTKTVSPYVTCWKTVWDHGTVSITVNGFVASTTYGQYSTAASIASSLASIFNNSGNSPVTATTSNATVYLTSKATGAASNYSLSSTSATGDPTDFGGPSFYTSNSGSTLTGGRNATFKTVYDSGTCTITVNSHGDSTSWSGSGTTTSSIASALVSGINGDGGASVSALLSGSTVNLTAKVTGASTNYAFSSSCSYDSSNFSGPSFTSSNSGSSLTGGRDIGPTTYDLGTDWIMVGGTQYSVSYGQTSTALTLASALATAINSSPGAPVTASVSGATVNLTATAVGSSTNYTLSAGSSSANGFSPPSFSVSDSGASLTGGTDTTAPTVTITYSYDTLNREISRTYSNGDPSVSTSYDQSNCLGLAFCQNIGHRTSMTDAAGSEAWSYQVDATNNRDVHQEQRTTSGVTKNTTYYLDLGGNLTSVVYPTGRVVNYNYNAANRPITAQDSANGITYATAPGTPLSACPTGAACYTPQGSIYSMSVGVTPTFTGLNISETFNSRLQPLEIKASSPAGNALDLSYNFVDPANAHNAGHVYGITNNLNSSRSQSFTYDQVNRIVSAGTTATTGSYCWGYQYTYDAWGNLLSQEGWSPTYNNCTETVMSGVTAGWNNHISGFSYDAAGNTLSDGVYSYTWNAESQMKTAAGVRYLYDGDGRRVSKSSGKLYWYGSGGEILAETNASGATTAEYIFFAGRRVAMLAGSLTQYYVEDFLGSSRVVTQSDGTICYDADFTPFGGERAYTNTCSQNAYKFEGKERDSETQNDDFGARYYSWRFGRWLSSDWSAIPVPVPYANLTNPQTLNLYAMVADDPESFADLDGHDPPDGAKNGTVIPGAPCQVQGCKKVGESDQDRATVALQTNQVKAQDTSTLQKAEKAVDWFNDTLGFGKSNCAGGGSCLNALGMAATAVIAAVASGGESEEAALARSEAKIGNLAKNLAKEGTLEAAEREVNGGMKVIREDGKLFDHADFVSKQIGGLERQSTHLERFIREHPGLSDSQKERAISAIRFARDTAAAARTFITPKDPI